MKTMTSGRPWVKRWATAAAAACFIGCAATGASAQTTTEEMKRMSLADLLQLDVTTVNRGPEPIGRVPAAIHVITQDDIRRSGALSIPEALRLAPGMQVARIDAGTWSIGMRGFADRLARSMLVLIDGRAVYSPLFAGTYWETQDVLLEDVDRIEVIRGPGGTLWGANAVNGIINIITRTAGATQGALATAGGGNQDRGFVGARYGGSAGTAWNYRIYGKGQDRAAEFHPDDLDYDGFSMAQGGFRADWTPAADRVVTIQGDVYSGTLGSRPTVTTYSPPYAVTENRDSPLSGANLLARWSRPLAGRGRFQLQAFYNRTNRDEVPVGEDRDTADVDFQHTPPAAGRHQLVWGLGYRVTSGRIDAIAPTAFEPPTRTDSLYSGFVQDEIRLLPDRLQLVLGAKLEHNNYSGVEFQPGVRLAYLPDPDDTLWFAVTRAVRVPSRVETDYTTSSLLNASIPYFVRLQPNPDFTPERLVAYEAGYRVRPDSRFYLSFAGFYNSLDDVLSAEILTPFAEPAPDPVRLIAPVTFGNGLEGDSYGAEVSADVRPSRWWRWTASYSYVRIQLSKQPGSQDGSQERRNEGLSPRHQLQAQTSFDLPGHWSLDGLARYVSDLPAGPIPSYATVDARLAWQVTPRLELALVGQDLAQAEHVEWTSSGGNIGIQRSAYVKITWRQ
jgi:iron complex outermembrane receptor protein